MSPRTSGTRSAKAVIYVRVSTAEQTTANQLPELVQLAEARGFEIVEVIEEVMSAAKQRPGFERMMTLARRGKCQVVVCWALDRLEVASKTFATPTARIRLDGR
jgi:DNA invertase Pin-like site-specific DNA recombinase